MTTDFAIQKSAIGGRFEKDHTYNLRWLPNYLTEFPSVLPGVPLPLKWERCNFVSDAKKIIPNKHGVYCFSIDIGEPLPEKMHVPLYIGKAAPQYLSSRFENYLSERNKIKGREKVVVMLNMYRDKLTFWWATLPRVYVDVVEEHLLMSCFPPCNTQESKKDRLWGKAF